MTCLQAIEKKGKEHDMKRTIRSVSVGSFYIAPFITFLYNFVDKVKQPIVWLKLIALLERDKN